MLRLFWNLFIKLTLPYYLHVPVCLATPTTDIILIIWQNKISNWEKQQTKHHNYFQKTTWMSKILYIKNTEYCTFPTQLYYIHIHIHIYIYIYIKHLTQTCYILLLFINYCSKMFSASVLGHFRELVSAHFEKKPRDPLIWSTTEAENILD